ncbi:hypothetical protein F444_09270 [Phytophthora nicotianae P1976]|uniref:BZIP domain-containing protein n=1 Tax=Phytophthora nicotianae P1976 TaxID=1317066 RepID=A0A081A883_PHYNI|nr:hypothetical protein F444_09270 [Phytophthora nicotianae P1976]
MNRSAFCPPNTHHLSYDVIGSLPLRSALAQEDHEKSHERLGTTSCEDDVGIQTHAVSTIDSALLAELESWQRKSIQLRRKSRRETQRRYRKKQADYTTKLADDVKQLQGGIKKLQQQRASVGSVDTAKRNVWNVALAYSSSFRRVNTQGIRSQLEFLRAAMAPDVAFNGGFGPVELAESWCVLRWFDNVDVDIQSLVKSGEDSVVQTTKTSVTITERTLQNLFPHVCGHGSGDGRSAEMARLMARLVDQRIIMDGRTVFQWDSASNSMASVTTKCDLLSPILMLLGSLEDVSLLFDRALVSPDFQWRPTI